jgi:hypothetical protein
MSQNGSGWGAGPRVNGPHVVCGWVNEFEKAAFYVHRILRGGKPAELPVQATTTFITDLNVKTAKGRGLPVPPGLLVA